MELRFAEKARCGQSHRQCTGGKSAKRRGLERFADLTKPPGAAAIRAGVGALAEQPGFIAGGVTLGPPANLVLVAGYQESSSVPLLQVVCTPKP